MAIMLIGGLTWSAAIEPAASASTTGLTWAASTLVDHQPPFAIISSFLDVSCPSVSLCVAVDTVAQVVTSTDPTGGTNDWTTTQVDANDSLTGISCPSVSLCVAVTGDGDGFGGGDVVTSTDPTGGSGAWTAVRRLWTVPTPLTACRAHQRPLCAGHRLVRRRGHLDQPPPGGREPGR